MGKPPAVIIIARHGARLDAADKNWHLNSATPYDPPLTYGGWLQSQSLGNRIASILQKRKGVFERHCDSPANSSSPAPQIDDVSAKQGSARKNKIIIHSSPFLRCVQTAIAISAGIAHVRKTETRATNQSRPPLHWGSPQVRASTDSPTLSAIAEPEQLHTSPPLNPGEPPPANHCVAQLRIDGFLGEWLSPDYFENMAPPPSSILMVASAKAELLRPVPEASNIATLRKSSLGHFPGGWFRDRSPASSADEEEKTGLASMASLSHSLPSRMNTVSQGSETMIGVTHQPHEIAPVTPDGDDERLGYVPPAPSYAISNSAPIPAGYVAHAQNACVDVNYQWDSMRPPQEWGTGGEYGEEWSSMHKRFRNGLQRMIAWYGMYGTSVSATDGPLEDDGDVDTDTVLILVTHGAGCNALIGALTNQPVLLDVGMASLTMAVRKPEAGNVSPTISQSPKKTRRSSIDLGIADEYAVELIASTEHLRAASHPLGMPSPRLGAQFLGAVGRSSRPPFPETLDSSSVRASLSGSLHRSASGSHGLRPYPMISRSKLSSGLWGSETAIANTSISESSDSDSMPNFAAGTALPKNDEALTEATRLDESASAPLSPLVGIPAHRGLWSGRSENSPKRRWTSANH